MIKSFSPIKSRRPWPPISISFHIFFNKALLVLGRSFFTPGVFLFRYILTVAIYIHKYIYIHITCTHTDIHKYIHTYILREGT